MSVTRWMLVGEPARGEADLHLVTEWLEGAEPCALAPPSRGNYLSADPAEHPPWWLSPFGVGTTPTHHDGLAGWAAFLTTRRASWAPGQRPRPKRTKLDPAQEELFS